MRLPLRAATAALLVLSALAPAAHAGSPADPLVCTTHQLLAASGLFPYGAPLYYGADGDMLVLVGYDEWGEPVYEVIYDCPPHEDGS